MNAISLPRFFTWHAILFISLTFLGCSGGGNGGGGSVLSEVVYEGKTSGATLTIDNANKIFSEIWDEATPLPVVSKGFTEGEGKEDSGLKQRPTQWIRALARKGSFLSSSVKNILSKSATETIPGKVSGTFTISDDIINPDGSGTFTGVYNNFNDGGGMTIDGRMIFNVYAFDLARGLFLDLEVLMQTLSFKGSGVDFSVSGNLRFLTTLETNTETNIFNVVVLNKLDGETKKFEEYYLVTSYDDLLNPSLFSEELSGRIYIRSEGYVDFESLSPFWYDSSSQENPNRGGAFLMKGLEPSYAHVLVQSDSRVRIEVDFEGDGTLEDVRVYFWKDLSGSPVPNTGPQLSGLKLSPENSNSADDLTAEFEVLSDPNGDNLMIDYSWEIDGVEIPNEDQPVLSASYFPQESEVNVAVTVFVSDGIISETRRVSRTIKPPLAVMDVSFPPEISYGQETTFQIQTNSPEGTAISYKKVFGPSDLIIDSVSGEVSWTPSGPMFGNTQEVRFGLQVEAESGTAGYTGSITITDPTRLPPLVRTGVVVPNKADGIRIADLDGDGRVEILVTDNINLLYTLVFDDESDMYFQNWVYPFDLASGKSITAIEIHELNGDGNPDIIVGTGAGIFILDGVTRNIIGVIDDDYTFYRSIRVADIDNDARLEIIYLASNDGFSSSLPTINVYDAADLTLEWQSASLDFGNSLVVGNVDSDPSLEIITSNGYVFDGTTHTNEWTYGPGFGAFVDTGDLDNNGIEEIVGAERWDKVTVYNAALKTPLWEISKFNIGALLVTDIDDDPQAEILIGDAQWGNVTAYDGATGAGVEQWTINSQNHGVSSLAVGDTDGDKDLEFAWATGTSSSGPDSLVVAGLNPTIAVEWTNNNPKELDGPFVGGRLLTTSTDQKQLVFASPSADNGFKGTHLVAIDSITSRMTISDEIGSNWNDRAAMEGVDYDGDGIDEIFLTTSTLYDGYFTAYDFAENLNEWISSIDIGVGQAVARGDLNGDGRDDFITLTRDGYIFAHDVWNATLLWNSTQLPGFFAFDIAVADLEGDGVLEIIATSNNTISVYKKCGSLCPTSPEVYILGWQETLNDVGSLVVDDIDGDGRADIVVSVSDPFSFNAPKSTIWIYDGDTFAQKASYDVSGSITELAVAPHITGAKNLYVSVSNSKEGEVFTARQNQILTLDSLTGTEIWRSPILLGRIQQNSMSFADIEENGSFELLLGTSDAMYVTR